MHHINLLTFTLKYKRNVGKYARPMHPILCLLGLRYIPEKKPAPGLSLVTRLDCAGAPGGLEDAGTSFSCWEPIL